MFKHIYLPVDNSDYSNTCIEIGLELAKQSEGKITASHVYAAKMHDVRFRQMESGLPEEYQDEQELEKQRNIHDQLITKGMEVITDSYLDVPKARCKEEGVEFEGKSLEGRNWIELVRDIKETDYDLVILGSVGLGAIKDSQLGTVAERVIRRINTDTLVVKNIPALHGEKKHSSDKIVVAVDGSGHSFGGLKTGIELSRSLNKPLEIISTFDPYFHYAMFNSLTGVLSREASKVFKFEQQEKLHEDIIDKGLAKIYQAHLEISRKIAEDEGVDCTIRLLDGKVFEKVLQYAREENPYLLILGRIGVHSAPDMDIGGNTENLLRLVPCNVFLSSRVFKPPIDLQAEETIEWTVEGKERLKKIPGFVRPMATAAILRYALERGHSMITSGVITEAVQNILPAGAMQAMRAVGQKMKDEGMDPTGTVLDDVNAEMIKAHEETTRADETEEEKEARLAQEVIENFEKPLTEEEEVAFNKDAVGHDVTLKCSKCGTNMKSDVIKCFVCGAIGESLVPVWKEDFTPTEKEAGELSTMTTFDDKYIQWSKEALQILEEYPEGHVRRKAHARVEKNARIQNIPTVTVAFANKILNEKIVQEKKEVPAKDYMNFGAGLNPDDFNWSKEALERLERVPQGFMRDNTRNRVMGYCDENSIKDISLEVCETGIRESVKLMEQAISEGASLQDFIPKKEVSA
ncbi:MAG: universal stress protein [Candidatus Nitrohelix vancouverensis]|uniref:Universal stress protein n=1 Tax=Candidatus Nitrohelix vancouverensis TaxID=2705534 RepID=A0A7T0C3Z7_9BACT|nr:MAG: universal stress protein [Candidatus Nitrohelix vancouverensis]